MGKDKIERILGRRERKKQQTQEALEATAWRLFQRKGYDETTVEDITDAVDVSTRTFFRYFDSKEAVLFGDWRSNLDTIYELILSRPPEEHPLRALYVAMLQFTELNKANEPRLFLRKQLADSSSRIGDYERNVMNPEFEGMIAKALAQRLNVDSNSDPRPNIYAAVAIGAWYAARRMWVESGGERSVPDLLQEGFDFVDFRADGTPFIEQSPES
jgi:AcrR family transcriptional regulator